MMDDDANQLGLLLTEGRLLPEPLRGAWRAAQMAGSSGLINLPGNLLIVGLKDFRPADIDAFSGPAVISVVCERSFMLVSLRFEGLSFELIWEGVTAKEQGEPLLEDIESEMHEAFTFALCDRPGVVRSLRVATVHPAFSRALRRAQREILSREVTASQVQAEIRALFSLFPKEIPEERFHETSPLGG